MMKQRRYLPALALAATLALPLCSASVWAGPKPDGTARKTAQPWTGSPAAFEEAGREQGLMLPRVWHYLGLRPGSVVADVGAGGGWLTVRLARQVAPGGIVYAQDILPKYTNYIENRAKAEHLDNVRTILGTVTDPKLPANTMDAVVILNAYHEFDQPLAMLRHVAASLKRGGKLAILERDEPQLRAAAREAYKRTGKILQRLSEVSDNNPYTDDHRLAREVVEREAISCGFRLQVERQLGGPNYIVMFVKP